MLLTRSVIAALTLACAACSAARPADSGPAPFAGPASTPAAVERGRVMAAAKCGGCHAVGPTGASAMEAAPPLRDIAELYPPTQLQEAFGEGVMTGHPAMPQFELRPGEINDLIAYLESLRSNQAVTPG
ncbi:MAG TPA: cytochrome c [Brevundimonas sp.]|uniref:c-type cytochrome n=1 Tax=Brevundimonas sp. TaxID=1871086 RepID=UPI002ED8B031